MNSIILALRFTLIILFLSYPLFSQITLNLSTGQDATVRITNTTDSSFARSSDPSSPSLLMHSWTNSSDNFNMVPILSRSLINFEGLSSIPAGSVIKSATIHLKCSINDTYFPSHNFSESFVFL